MQPSCFTVHYRRRIWYIFSLGKSYVQQSILGLQDSWVQPVVWRGTSKVAPLCSILSDFKMNQRHQIEARIIMSLYALIICFIKYGHTQSLLLEDLPELSPAVLAAGCRHQPSF